jgi:exosortase E/protease (VPEID-CTERM system)
MMPLAPTTTDTPAARPEALRLPLVRWLALVALLFGELVLLMVRFDTESLRRAGQGWWADELWQWKFVLPPLAIAIATAAVLLGGERLRDELRRAASAPDRAQRPWPFLVAHLIGFAVFARLTAAILEGGFAGSQMRWAWITAWLATALASLACWGLCALPPRVLVPVARRTGAVLAAATAVGAAAWAAGLVTETWWDPLRASTIAVVGGMVRVIAPDPVVDPPSLVVGTGRFSVRILSACAGYEGIGLIWVFLGAYLWSFRRSLRFPHAFLLVPLGTAAVWMANALRLTALIAIGTWISPDVALGGFHTYSGSLLFSAVALALVFVVRRSPYFVRDDALPARAHGDDLAPAYLLPFLAIVAVTMLTGALSAGGFDTGYPLRVLVALGVLWTFRRAYHGVRPAWSWGAVAYGVVAFALWMALEPHVAAADTGPPLGAALVALPPALAAGWLAFRVVGAVVTVPIAEELAFRGYLLRRLVAADFARVPPRHFSWLALVGSSALFGAMHSRLVAGTLAGMLYALCFRRRGELADPILAHATTNALLAAYVLATGTWSLWG